MTTETRLLEMLPLVEKCPSCNKPFVEHLGLVGLCQKVERLTNEKLSETRLCAMLRRLIDRLEECSGVELYPDDTAGLIMEAEKLLGECVQEQQIRAQVRAIHKTQWEAG